MFQNYELQFLDDFSVQGLRRVGVSSLLVCVDSLNLIRITCLYINVSMPVGRPTLFTLD